MSDDLEEIKRLVTEGFARMESETQRLADGAHRAADRALELAPRVEVLEERQRKHELRLSALEEGGTFEAGDDGDDC